MSNLLAPQLLDEASIHHLQDKLANHDIPATERLYSSLQEARKELVAQVNAEYYTSHSCSQLIKLFDSFLELIQAFTRDGIHLVACSSTGYFTPENNLPADSEAVSNANSMIEDFMYQIMEYYQHFDMLLRKESAPAENNARLLVKSYVAHYLETILYHTEQVIRNTETTLEILDAWEIALQNREDQELYN